jgi:hypothetical protein
MKTNIVLIVLLSELLLSPPAWGWFAGGHEIAAIIAADDLTPTAKSHVAQILGVPADTGSVEKAMAAASIQPDTEFREEDRSTAPWHYIDICLQDKESDLPARCPNGNCVTAKINGYAGRLVSQFEIRRSTNLNRTVPTPRTANSVRLHPVAHPRRRAIISSQADSITLVDSRDRMMFVRYGPSTIDFAQADRQAKI